MLGKLQEPRCLAMIFQMLYVWKKKKNLEVANWTNELLTTFVANQNKKLYS